MPYFAIVGVKATDIEQAKVWVEELTGLVAEARENSSLGGDYYAFDVPDQLDLMLVKNCDCQDGEPVVDAPAEWKLVLTIESEKDDVGLLDQLEKDSRRFHKVRVERY